MSSSRGEAGSAKRRSASIQFVEQFLRQGQQGRLAGLLLGQLDSFNRIASTFGHERCELFCSEVLGQAPRDRCRRARRSSGCRPSLRGADRRRLDVGRHGRRDQLTEDIRAQIEISGDTFLVDVTLGIAVYPSHADDAATLFRRAELALKEARENELSFDIYQTRRDVAAGRALEVRERPQERGAAERARGLLPTESRNRAAARMWRRGACSLAHALGQIRAGERFHSARGDVRDRRADYLARVRSHRERIADWKALPRPFSIAVNVSPQVLVDSEFMTRLKKLKLCVRRKRSRAHDRIDRGQPRAWRRLLADRARPDPQARYLDLAIDDFGKGYSSLSYLKQIPADEIKIDKRFIGTIALDDKDKQIVKTVIALAHALDMRVVAEGVDSAENLAVVAEIGCEMAQGFFIGRPMRGDLVPDWLDHYLRSPRIRASRLARSAGARRS